MQLLRAVREEKQISGKQLAIRSGLHQSTISLLDRGERKPSLDSLVKIAEVLGVDLGEILQRATGDVRSGGDSRPEKKQARTRRAG